MRVEVLFLDGCPHHAATVALVREVTEQLMIHVDVVEVEVARSEDAPGMRFLSSPTVRVNGRDVEVGRRADTNYVMSCRLYGANGVPPREWIESALRSELTP